MENKFSRRDFIKVTLLSLSAAFLAACERLIKPTKAPFVTATSTNTNTAMPTATKTQTPTPTETPSPTEIPCFRLLTPENGAELPNIGIVIFSWEAMPGAARYQLQFTFPSGQVISFDTESTSEIRYIESFLAGGIYTWHVIAFDENNVTICIAKPFTFEKPEYISPQMNGNNPPKPPSGHLHGGPGG